MNVPYIMIEVSNDGFFKSESDVHRLGDRPAYLGGDCVVSFKD